MGRVGDGWCDGAYAAVCAIEKGFGERLEGYAAENTIDLIEGDHIAVGRHHSVAQTAL